MLPIPESNRGGTVPDSREQYRIERILKTLRERIEKERISARTKRRGTRHKN